MAEKSAGSPPREGVVGSSSAGLPVVTPDDSMPRVVRIVMLVVTAAILVILAWEIAVVIPLVAARPGAIGVDFVTYRAAAESWLAGDGFYLARQLAGPYQIVGAESALGAVVLYPPVALWLFVPFTVLPAVLWWIIPAAAAGWALWRLRPSLWVWPLLALLAALPFNLDVVVRGNPLIWVAAAFAVGCAVAGPAVLVLIKPSLAPFALMGVNRRRWWIALAAFTLACVPFGV